ncbi:glutaredoxin family protein [Marinobacter halodurans]|uniref:Glutaredoxin family protein n=1 Tax=Marinobacter halodurans TaxID=2528979 RepID=A0ABY1ZM11_9GAMM|nr:glutaredoxin family protein [Marinobacter halodurans]TBW56732.1 glutaredoxin family protein [Marinobacter halodurans]
MQLVFYTTDNCQLCGLAETLLVQTPMDPPIPVDVVDIAQSTELVARYGERIPVLRRADNGRELDWPFTRDDLMVFLDKA